tara:strand:- start:597 stop:989 length:393 start_codon:yes stop_codon:yes gene_type:complete
MRLPDISSPKILSYVGKEIVGPMLHSVSGAGWNGSEMVKGATLGEEGMVKEMVLRCMLRVREEITTLETMSPRQEDMNIVDNEETAEKLFSELKKAKQKQLMLLRKMVQTIYFALTYQFEVEESTMHSGK